MKYKYILHIAPVILLSLSSCGKKQKQDTAPPATPVTVAEAEKAEATYYDKYQATVVAINNVELRSQITGFITGIFFKEGSVVTKGTPLYEIDRRKYIAAYQQAQANLTSANANLVKAQKDVERYNMLLKNDAVARQTVDQAQATYATNQGDVAVAKAGVESARTDLSYSIIKAPFTGRIGISQVRMGSQVTPGSTLLNTITSEHPIGVDVVINEQDLQRFYKLQKHNTDTTFRLQLSDGNTEYKAPGKIIAIDNGVNNQTGTIKVRVQFPNQQDILKDGMSGVLKVLNNDSGNRVQIPYQAVSEQVGEFFVFVAQDTIAKQHKVMLGPRIGDKVVILSGINQGDKVITNGIQRLRDGGKITLGSAPQQQQAGKQTTQGAAQTPQQSKGQGK